MPSVEFMGKTFNVDEDGFIDSYDNWTRNGYSGLKKKKALMSLTMSTRK